MRCIINPNKNARKHTVAVGETLGMKSENNSFIMLQLSYCWTFSNILKVKTDRMEEKEA